MKHLIITVLIALLLSSCGTLGIKTGVFDMQKVGDNGAIGFNDEDVEIYPDGTIKSDITSIHVLELQVDTSDTNETFQAYFLMWIDLVKEHAGVYKSIGD